MIETLRDVRKLLESGKPVLALPPSPLEVVEVTDPKSPEFKKAMEIYRKTFPEEEREEEYKIARYVRNTQKTGRAKPGGNAEFHLLVIKDNGIKGSDVDKVIGHTQISYFPEKRFAARWYTAIDPSRRGSWRNIVEGLNGFRKQIEGYASKHGEKPIGFFNDVTDEKKDMGKIIEKTGYFLKDIEFEIPSVRKGGKPQRTRLGFTPYESIDLPGLALKGIIADYFRAGFGIGKDVTKNPQYQQAIRSIKDDHLYRFAKKS